MLNDKLTCFDFDAGRSEPLRVALHAADLNGFVQRRAPRLQDHGKRTAAEPQVVACYANRS